MRCAGSVCRLYILGGLSTCSCCGCVSDVLMTRSAARHGRFFHRRRRVLDALQHHCAVELRRVRSHQQLPASCRSPDVCLRYIYPKTVELQFAGRGQGPASGALLHLSHWTATTGVCIVVSPVLGCRLNTRFCRVSFCSSARSHFIAL